MMLGTEPGFSAIAVSGLFWVLFHFVEARFLCVALIVLELVLYVDQSGL